MKIGIYTKFGITGGSEFRGIEMANAISDYTNHEISIFAEKNIIASLKEYLNPNIPIYTSTFKSKENIQILCSMDSILIINSDSKKYTTTDYWMKKIGESNLKKIK